ncbi:MAG: GNAT family N-acetyltransferase [Candidatus Aenigmarchaeota archaeon]|nr:GNAT family N-acetyltransferase [Candidatus Aenigmarchaeota archaeon]
MEFIKIKIPGTTWFYWTWRDLPFLPYAWLEEKDLKNLPTPFILTEIHPDCPVGFETKDKSDHTNIIKLPDSFDKLKIDNDLRKDLRRIEKKNADVKLVYNEKDALDKSKKWFLKQWKENKKDFARRLELWKQKCCTISAYLDGKLIAVHIAMRDKDTIYYFGCWWDRKYKNLSVPTFLLKKDIEDAISKHSKYYDLEVGDEAYKKQWGVIENPTKYYAVLTDAIAKRLGIEKYVKTSSSLTPSQLRM